MTGTVLEIGMTWLGRASWQAAILGFIVLLATWVLRERLEARWRFCLWLVVLMRLAIPTTPPAPWSVFQLLPSTSETPVAIQPQAIAVPTPIGVDEVADADPVPLPQPSAVDIPEPAPNRVASGRTVADGDADAEPSADLPAPAAVRSVPSSNESNATFGTAKQCLALVWLVGLLALLARQCRLQVKIRQRRRTWHEVSDPIVRELFLGCRTELGIRRRVHLLTTPDDFGPATYGAFRPTILLPEKLLPILSREELRLVLLHELIHVARFDVLLDRVAFALAAVHWFNPVAWLALARMRRERELACDAAVLRRLGESEFGGYGHALLKIAEHQSASVLLPGAVGVFGKDQSLVRRIHVIAKFKRPKVVGKVLGWLAILGLVAIGLTDAIAQAPADKAKEPVAPTAKKEEPAKTISIAGVCRDENGKPIAGAQVMLYREDDADSKVERLRTTATGDDGRFELRELPPFQDDRMRVRPTWRYTLAITKQGRGSHIRYLFADCLAKPTEFKLGPAATLKGRVTNAEGKPVAGARVWTQGLPIEGILSTRTDADGRYAITDMTAWGPDAHKPKAIPGHPGVFSTIGGCFFRVHHAEYAKGVPYYRNMPDTVDVVLQTGGTIEGKIVDQVTGKPAIGALVYMQGIKGENGEGHARTDPDGKYRINSLAAGKYNISAESPDRTCAALDSYVIDAGKTHSAPDLTLIEGGWIEGRLVEAGTGKPFSGDVKEGRLNVGLYGPSRPKSGAACEASPVDDRGHFRLRVAPGLNFPYIMGSEYWERTQQADYYKKGVEVKAGEAVNVVFHILPTKPIPDPAPTPVRLPIPVEAERQGAARIRQFGGNYSLDADSHVVDVIMIQYESMSVRDGVNVWTTLVNDITDTDEALRTANAFPRLKRLILNKGQATDDGLKSLATLANLESLYISKSPITAAGVSHLTGLKQLKNLDLPDGQLGDDALAVLGKMRQLRRLSIGGNSFSDDGLKHLADLKELRSLSLGFNRPPLTDAGVKHLAGLTALESLDLQMSQLGDAGVVALKDMKQLQNLSLYGTNGAAPVTDACVDHLLGLTKLKVLWLQNSRLTEQGVLRLLALPDLKDLSVGITTNPERLRKEIQKKRPDLKVYLTGPPDKE